MELQTVKAVKSKRDGSVMLWLPSGSSVFWPGALTNKPDYRNKYITVNCNKYKIEWTK